MVVCGAAYYALTYLYLHNDSRLCTLLVGRFDIFIGDRVQEMGIILERDRNTLEYRGLNTFLS